ncbi:MAG: hypothetical protein JXB13_10050 [Phycisphaerae bacterium]|nr:hypothetical protein [Phycisphaerae bacterium]
MKKIALLGIVLVVTAGVWADARPPVPQTPAAVDEIVYARPFSLETGYQFQWNAEKPLVREGYVLVLKVDPALAVTRQALEPVLYVGQQTAERVSVSEASGHIVAIVPGPVDKLDLTQTPVWFGTPALPEQVNSTQIAAENVQAAKAGIVPFDKPVVERALANGGARLRVADYSELRRQLADVIEQYSPQEKDLINGLRAPRVE